MRKALLVLVVGAALASPRPAAKTTAAPPRPGPPPRRPAAVPEEVAAPGGGRPPMPVEFAVVKRAPVAEQILIVGNLIGAATVQVVPRVNGRLATVNVQLGDSVRRGQTVAKVEDLEIQEQVRQAEAAFKVAQATIRQRDADLKLATTNLDRSKSLYDRQLLPQQTYDDTVARLRGGAGAERSRQRPVRAGEGAARGAEDHAANTIITSPVDGFVGKRFSIRVRSSGPTPRSSSVVDIRTVRMVANLVEKDMKRVPSAPRGGRSRRVPG